MTSENPVLCVISLEIHFPSSVRLSFDSRCCSWSWYRFYLIQVGDFQYRAVWSLESSIETQPHHSQSNAEPNKNKPKTQPLPSSYRAPDQGNSAQLPCHTLSCSPTPFGLQSFPAHTCGRCSLPQAAGALLSTKRGRNHANYPLLWNALPWWRPATRPVQQSLSEGL